MKVAYVIFYTTDLERIKKFYLDLGFTLATEQKGKVLSFALDDDIMLGIKLGDKERELSGSQTVILKVDDIEEQFERLKEEGYAFYKEVVKQDWGTSFSILDPDGNKVEFMG